VLIYHDSMIEFFAGSLEVLLEFGYFVYRLLSTSVYKIVVD